MGGNHESIHGTDATTCAGEASSQAVVISAQERARIDMLDREVFQLNEPVSYTHLTLPTTPYV